MSSTTHLVNRVVAVIPLLFPAALLVTLLQNPVHPILHYFSSSSAGSDSDSDDTTTSSSSSSSSSSTSRQLWAYVVMSVWGYVLTDKLIPNIKQYTLRKGISGKDLGKRGTSIADKDIPEALGIVPGGVFLVCLMLCLVGYAATYPAKLLDVHAALLSICFMLFLGFTDDVLDWPWRYKLILPTVASLPLLCCYGGSTSIVIPIQLRSLLWTDNSGGGDAGGTATWFGHFIHTFLGLIIDSNANGALLELGWYYHLYMGMLAVFCTNAINIYAGINGLEAGQAYIVACAVMMHNLVEIRYFYENNLSENHLFSLMIMLCFVGCCLGILKHNWYPASIFVGDTFCYFAGMTFAVVGILGHFSKTLLLFFIPQIVNFIWSCPQLFKMVPCPRHRLPKFDPATGMMRPSTFTCAPNQYRWLRRVDGSQTEIPNMTLINLALTYGGPMTERQLCVVLLAIQLLSCGFGLLCRYYIAQFFFEG